MKKSYKVLSVKSMNCGNTTIAEVEIASYLTGEIFSGKGKSVCSENDKFDEFTGMALARDRATTKAVEKMIKSHTKDMLTFMGTVEEIKAFISHAEHDNEVIADRILDCEESDDEDDDCETFFAEEDE